jgi:hypothetical protein
MPALKGGLGSLKQLLADVKTLSGWATKGVIAAPLADFALAFGPPWPSQLPVLTSCAGLIVLLLVLTYGERGSLKVLTRRVVGFALCTGALFMGHSALSSHFITATPRNERVSAGFVVRSDVTPLIGDGYTTSEALRDGGWDPEAVWTRDSITLARLTLMTTWLSTFGCFVSCLGFFSLRSRKKKHIPVAPKGPR